MMPWEEVHSLRLLTREIRNNGSSPLLMEKIYLTPLRAELVDKGIGLVGQLKKRQREPLLVVESRGAFIGT